MQHRVNAGANTRTYDLVLLHDCFEGIAFLIFLASADFLAPKLHSNFVRFALAVSGCRRGSMKILIAGRLCH